MYGLQELASARQHHIGAKLLIVDDAAYGILREYQEDAFGATHSVDLVQPDFVSLSAAYGVPAREATPESLGDTLAWAFGIDGPAVVVLRTKLHWIRPTA
jgi:acetolactate synthase-1/2/3 large subunit